MITKTTKSFYMEAIQVAQQYIGLDHQVIPTQSK